MPAHFPLIIGKIIKRFGVTIGPGYSTDIAPLTPITDMDALALDALAEATVETIAATGDVVMHTVPAGERWQPQYLSVGSTGNFTWQMTFLRETSVGSGVDVRVKIERDSAGYFGRTIFPTGTLWFPGDRLIVDVSAYTSGGDFDSNLAYLREECAT